MQQKDASFGSWKTDIDTCSFSEEILKKKNIVQEQYFLCKTEINELLGTRSLTNSTYHMTCTQSFQH